MQKSLIHDQHQFEMDEPNDDEDLKLYEHPTPAAGEEVGQTKTKNLFIL